MRISEIAAVTEGKFVQFYKDFEIQTLEIDSRKPGISINSLFFALVGPNRDGHDFIRQAYEKGTRNFVVSKEGLPLPEANFLRVRNTLDSLQTLASTRRKEIVIPVVAITGSNGKTIVKEWLSWILTTKYRVTKSPKSFNSQIGVPLSVWALDESTEIGVFEAGISKSGEMDKLAAIIRPTIGIFTNIGEAHAAGFHSIEHKLDEKLRLFEHSDRIIYCFDQENIRRRIDIKKGFSWSLSNDGADLVFKNHPSGFYTWFENKEYILKTRFSASQDVENLLHAITSAIYLGLSQEEINKGLEGLKSVAMRLQLKSGANEVYILDDTYNNDLAGLRIALEHLEQQPLKKRRTVILSDILQSGLGAQPLYREINRQLVNHKITRLIGVGEEISSSAEEFTMERYFFPSTQALVEELPSFANEIVLVKGARGFELERIVSILEEKSHGTLLEVNMEAIGHNLREYRNRLNPETKIMVMVKAFAYGGGLNEIAHLLQFHKVDYLGVAYLDEGIQLRRSGLQIPIMVMNPDWDHLALLSEFDLQPEIYSLPLLQHFIEVVKVPRPIHVKVETGMNRLGFTEAELERLATLLKTNAISVAGIFTHFSSTDNPAFDEFTVNQASKFDRMYEHLSSAIGQRPIKHALNSSGISRWPEFQYDMVRLGIGLYGFDSSNTGMNLRTVSTLKARVSQVKVVRTGESIGYNRVGKVPFDKKIAILSIGYADGYLRVFSNGNAYVIINGRKASTIGNVCMDMVMVDVTGLDVKEGDEAVIFGADPTIVDLADWADTIPYEILTNIGQRVKRVFVSE